MFNFKNLQPKLILAFALFLLVPSIAIGATAAIIATDTIKEQYYNTIDKNLGLLNTSINSLMENKIDNVDFLSKEISSSDDDEYIAKIMDQYVELNEDAESVFLGKDDGSVTIAPYMAMDKDFDVTERDWYKDAIANKGQAVISHPYISTSSNNVVVTISKSIAGGVVGINLKLSHIAEITGQINVGEEGYAVLLDRKGEYIVHPEEETGTPLGESFYDVFYSNEASSIEYDYFGDKKVVRFITNELTGWKLGGNMYLHEIDEAAAPIIKATIIVILIMVVVGVLLIFILIRSIIRPIKDLKEKALMISDGDLTQTIDVKTTDEIGELGQAFGEMQESLKSLIHKIEQNAELVAASAEQLSANSEETTAVTQEVSASIQQVSLSAEKQKDSVDTSVHAFEEITEGAVQIANYSAQVSALTNETTKQAYDGGQSVENIVNQMKSIHQSVIASHQTIQSLNDRSKQVNSILNIITGIAEQTNLLSLNASIEAARAGEHGKGFAVVANEVKQLANQSHQSTKDIYEIISAIQNDTENTVSIMDRISHQVENGVEVSNEALAKFSTIIESMEQVTPQIEEVSATAQQVSASILETSSSVREMALFAQDNAAISEEVAASSEQQLIAIEEISTSAQALTELAQELQLVIAKFKY
ncbi:methyl-accepting chemotaxis protein [Solibacillus sp. FSL W7-1464]|uniref:methyl-accepting chemotaxis protein n=1 Tax=Solibacillus sp. FSL W7-1464 TaxID=2921706 RepID=UPI0030FB2E3C